MASKTTTDRDKCVRDRYDIADDMVPDPLLTFWEGKPTFSPKSEPVASKTTTKLDEMAKYAREIQGISKGAAPGPLITFWKAVSTRVHYPFNAHGKAILTELGIGEGKNWSVLDFTADVLNANITPAEFFEAAMLCAPPNDLIVFARAIHEFNTSSVALAVTAAEIDEKTKYPRDVQDAADELISRRPLVAFWNEVTGILAHFHEDYTKAILASFNITETQNFPDALLKANVTPAAFFEAVKKHADPADIFKFADALRKFNAGFAAPASSSTPSPQHESGREELDFEMHVMSHILQAIAGLADAKPKKEGDSEDEANDLPSLEPGFGPEIDAVLNKHDVSATHREFLDELGLVRNTIPFLKESDLTPLNLPVLARRHLVYDIAALLDADVDFPELWS